LCLCARVCARQTTKLLPSTVSYGIAGWPFSPARRGPPLACFPVPVQHNLYFGLSSGKPLLQNVHSASLNRGQRAAERFGWNVDMMQLQQVPVRAPDHCIEQIVPASDVHLGTDRLQALTHAKQWKHARGAREATHALRQGLPFKQNEQVTSHNTIF
jgi:hypothetical protein